MKTRETLKYNFFRILFYPWTHRLSLWRTLYFNLNYFPVRVALRFPVFIHKGVRFKKMNGRVDLSFSPVTTGSVRIGKERYGFHTRHDLTIWEQLGGTVIFGKEVSIGKGCFFSIGKNAVLKFGNNIVIGGNDKFICRKSVEIGEGTITGWDVQIMDTDFHPTVNTVFNTLNCMEKPIVIGCYNWLCIGSIILKGSVTPDYCIVSANTTIKSDYSRAGENIVLDHNPEAKVTARYIRFGERTMDENEESRNSRQTRKIFHKHSDQQRISG